LFAARDRVGIEPLFYTRCAGQLVSPPGEGLFAHPAVPRELDLVGLDQVFTYWTAIAPRTVWKGVEQLPPGCALAVEDGRVRTWRYWDFDFSVDPDLRDEARCAEELRERLVDATRLRLRADVPTGAYLSGGLDSSLIASLVRNYTDTPLRTFSVTFDDPEFDESRYQAEVIRMLGTDHSSIRCGPGDVGRIFDQVIWHAESPVLRTAPAPLFLLSSLVRQHGYKVVLTGEGSDEVLGGYDLFKEAKLRRFCAAQPGSELRPRLFERLYPYMKNLQAEAPAYRQLFFRSGEGDQASPYFSHLPRWDVTSRLRQFYSPSTRAALAGRAEHEDVARLLPADFARWEALAQAQFLEAAILLPGYLLASQGDRMALGHSVEARFPFLDHRVIEFANRLPARMKLRVLDEKHVLKRAARGLVPESVLRRSKQPYRAPDGVELLGASREKRPGWVDELLSPERLAADGVFQPVAVRKLVEKFEAGRAVGQRDNMALVGIASTQVLLDRFVRGDGS
jgi:asparagine synthase (glutamine-hydrolysing)